MAYTIERAAGLAVQLERLVTSGVHQIAGQFANLEFWLAESVLGVTLEIEDLER